jgi:hypothetical protein
MVAKETLLGITAPLDYDLGDAGHAHIDAMAIGHDRDEHGFDTVTLLSLYTPGKASTSGVVSEFL